MQDERHREGYMLRVYGIFRLSNLLKSAKKRGNVIYGS